MKFENLKAFALIICLIVILPAMVNAQKYSSTYAFSTLDFRDPLTIGLCQVKHTSLLEYESNYTDLDSNLYKENSLGYLIDDFQRKFKLIGYDYRGMSKCIPFDKSPENPPIFKLYFKKDDSTAICIDGILDIDVVPSNVKEIGINEIRQQKEFKLFFTQINVEKYFLYYSKRLIIDDSSIRSIYTSLELNYPKVFNQSRPNTIFAETFKANFFHFNEHDSVVFTPWEYPYQFDPRKYYGKELKHVLNELQLNAPPICWINYRSYDYCDSASYVRQCFELYFKSTDTTAMLIRGLLPAGVELPVGKAEAYKSLLAQKHHWLAFSTVDIKEYLRYIQEEYINSHLKTEEQIQESDYRFQPLKNAFSKLWEKK